MSNKWKQLCAILLLIAIIALFTSCGGNTTEGKKETNSPSASTQQLPQSSDEAGTSAEIESSTETEQGPEIVKETLEDKAKTALETLEVWDGSIAESFDGGDGSAGNPYQIANGAQLAKLASDTNSGVDFSGKYFVLTSDILLNDFGMWNYDNGEWIFGNSVTSQSWSEYSITFSVVNDWKPIGLNNFFGGTFDGSGHMIFGLYCSGVYRNSITGSISGNVGLFGTLRKGTVSNVTVAYSWISPSAEYVGTIVGESDAGIINNCHMTETIVRGTAKRVGGICGNISNWDYGGEINNCSTNGMILAFPMANSDFTIGGIVGNGTSYDESGKVYNCYNRSTIKLNAEVPQDYSGELPSINAGGICGTGAIITDCYNAGSIEFHVQYNFDESSSEDTYIRIGGIAGTCVGSITNCGNGGSLIYIGDVRETYIGGIAGLLGTYYNGKSSSEDVDVSFCYSNAEISTSISTGNMGGIAGSANGEITVTNCCYSKECSDRAIAVVLNTRSSVFTDQIKGLTENEFKDSSNYYGFDFDFTWSIDANRNDGLPVLISLIEYFEN